MTDYKLIIFDLDGTIVVDRDSAELLTGVREWFEMHHQRYQIAFATNQGGVGLRLSMEKEGFGNPAELPTEALIWQRIDQVQAQLPGAPYRFHVCFAYQNRRGKWSPTPPDKRDRPEWSPGCRKPAPGMLEAAMRAAQVDARQTLMVGDRKEDHLAAKAAHCDFQWAWEFFGREKPSQP